MIEHDKIIELIKEASSLVMAHYNTKVNVKYKHDNSAVSEVDEKSHHLIAERLSKLTSHIPVISEECQDHECVEIDKLTDFWLIDPLDGTDGFLNGNDNFTINIAYMESKKPKYGYIIIPCKDEIYYNDDHHAYCIDKTGKKRIFKNFNAP